MNKKTLSVGVAFITHTAKHHLRHCLPPILQSPLKPRVLVVNSSSNDGTVEEAKRWGAETLLIPRIEFNHGSTREKARHYLGTDIVVMMTPDAYAMDSTLLTHLTEPLIHHRASAAYARQIPHEGATFLERFARDFNYPTTSHIRSLEELSTYGTYTFFCSNACAAYLNRTLDDIGGFPSVLLGEDTCAVARLLHQGHKIAYVAEAVVKHSHRYSLKQEFKRNFDIGLARSQFQELIRLGGKDEKRGLEYLKQLLKTTFKEKPHLLPYACLQTLIKWVAYRIGKVSVNAPLYVKQALSSQDFYWTSRDFKDSNK